jgi:hypothetical protein
LGGKVEEVEKNLLLLLPLATKPSTFSFSFQIRVLSSFSWGRQLPIEFGKTLVLTSP